MGRFIKTGLDYFPFDVDFHDDDKVALLTAEFNVLAEAVIVRLLCKIYKNGYYYQWGGDERLLFCRWAGGIFVPAQVDEVVKGCLRRSFFDKGVFEAFGVLTSSGIQKRFLQACNERKSVDIISDYWLLEIPKNPQFRIFRSINEINRPINPINRPKKYTKKSKVNISSPNVEDNHPYPPFEEGIRSLHVDDDSWKCNLQVREHLEENGFTWKSEIAIPDRGDGKSGRIDLIAIRGNEKYAIEIDYVTPRDKSVFKLNNFDDDYVKVILLRGGTKDYMLGKIHVMSLAVKEKVAPKRKAPDLSTVDPAFRPVLEDWLAYKAERNETYTPRGFQSCVKKLLKLSEGNPETARAIIEESMANNWQGFFPLKNTDNENRKNKNSRRDYGSLDRAIAEGISRARTPQDWE